MSEKISCPTCKGVGYINEEKELRLELEELRAKMAKAETGNGNGEQSPVDEFVEHSPGGVFLSSLFAAFIVTYLLFWGIVRLGGPVSSEVHIGIGTTALGIGLLYGAVRALFTWNEYRKMRYEESLREKQRQVLRTKK